MRRGSGVLLPVSSLPSPYGVGDLGPEAYRFVDFLCEAGQAYWQLLPLTPTDPAQGNSPYLSPSAFAGNPLFISLDLLVEEGLLQGRDLLERPPFQEGRADYEAALAWRERLLQQAWEAFRLSPPWQWEAFLQENAFWLQDYCLFRALKRHFGGKPWQRWPKGVRRRDREVLEPLKEQLKEEVQREAFLQFLFFKQWQALRRYCNRKGVQVIGDIPIYVTQDGADTWAHPEVFRLGPDGRPEAVAGVPPDCFSPTGQRWGNPLYRWDVLREERYGWWIERIKHNLALYDLLRLDHFRGFVAYWEIPPGQKDARKGRWVEGPGEDLFLELQRRFASLPIIAEDLGLITPDVREVMGRFGFPGMRVLQFAFGEDFPNSPYLPHNYPRNCVAYTGTHDNNTLCGWFAEEATAAEKERLFRYLGRKVQQGELAWELVRLLMASVADGVVVPVQDLLGLGSEARMNRPASSRGNWRWRLKAGDLTQGLALRLRELTETYGRL